MGMEHNLSYVKSLTHKTKHIANCYHQKETTEQYQVNINYYRNMINNGIYGNLSKD